MIEGVLTFVHLLSSSLLLLFHWGFADGDFAAMDNKLDSVLEVLQANNVVKLSNFAKEPFHQSSRKIYAAASSAEKTKDFNC